MVNSGSQLEPWVSGRTRSARSARVTRRRSAGAAKSVVTHDVGSSSRWACSQAKRATAWAEKFGNRFIRYQWPSPPPARTAAYNRPFASPSAQSDAPVAD